MSDEKIKFDKWQVVEEALKKSSVENDSKSTRLVFVLVAQTWNPTSLFVAKEVEKLRSAKILTIKSPMFILDADDEKNRTWENGPITPEINGLGVTATPALFFYVGGKPLSIRRTDYACDTKFVGSCSKENLLELFQSARAAENDGAKVLYADF